MGFNDWPSTILLWHDPEDFDNFGIATERKELPDEDGIEVASFKLDRTFRLSVKKDLVTS